MRGLSILPAVLFAGCVLVFAGCRGCGCSPEERDAGVDAGPNTKPVQRAQPAKDEAGASREPARSERAAGKKPDREGIVEMKPGVVLSTSGRGSTGAGEAPSVGNPNVPPATVRAISALKDFQRAHPKLVVKERENAGPRAPHSEVNKERSTEGLRKVTGAPPGK
ncbi:MAG TPA: hypothetical protein VM425_11530 [Myxococcota bacterium]|nr:hypothetical protein [Myxococcota bacterium]